MCNPKDEGVGMLLVQVCRAHRSRAHTLFSAFGLHVGQDMILFELSKQDGQTLSDLAEKLRLQPPTLTRMARRMGKNGLLARRNCPKDGRVFRLYLTNKGREVKKKLDRAWEQLETETTKNLNSEQQATLHKLLRQVKNTLNTPPT